MKLCRDQNLLIAGGAENCVRLLPALIMTEEEAREVLTRLEAACQAAQSAAQTQANPA
jgi:acetylornithine/N-succinyldiaminopimelate aminotransferase